MRAQQYPEHPTKQIQPGPESTPNAQFGHQEKIKTKLQEVKKDDFGDSAGIAGSPDGHVLSDSDLQNRPTYSESNTTKLRLTGQIARRNERGVERLYWDEVLPGFGLRVYATGTKRWIVQLRQRGVSRRITLGDPARLSAGDARRAARGLLAKNALDGVPQRPARPLRSEPRFTDYIDEFWHDYARHWKRSTQQRNRAAIEKTLIPWFGRYRLASIKRAHIQEAAERPLNPGQLAAATLILSSPDRSIIVQGVAGAGKSTMLQAVARVAEAEGRLITGLAFQNKMVADLGEGAGIKAQTIASFVRANERFIAEQGTERHAASPETFAGSMLIVDETSMVSSSDMLKIHDIADALGVDKLVLVGDRQQLSSIDAGKAFAIIQAGGGTMARMDANLRQRTDQLRTVAALANIGKAGAALAVLGDNVIEVADPASAAADLWLALPGKEREVTAIFASGRDARAIINERIQDGLVAEGSVKGEAYRVTVYERINTTREELRHVSTYRAGQTLEVGAGGARDVGIAAGRYDVVKVLRGGKIELADGRRRFRFDPLKLSPTERRDRLQLAEKKSLVLREGDYIRWTANDKERGLFNSALARIAAVETAGIVVETADRQYLRLGANDPMLSRLDLAYSLNMHMAQGITTDKAITVMSSHERHLSNQRLFNVGVTRVRDVLTMVIDDKAKLSRQLDINPGNKTSALETLGRIDVDGRKDAGATMPFDLGPTDGLGLPDLPQVGSNLPPLPASIATDGSGTSKTRGEAQKNGRGDTLPPLPERSLGLDL